MYKRQQLDFSIEDETLAAMTACRSLLTRISAERLYGELTRLLCGPAAGRVLAGCGDILVPVIPAPVSYTRLDGDKRQGQGGLGV